MTHLPIEECRWLQSKGFTGDPDRLEELLDFAWTKVGRFWYLMADHSRTWSIGNYQSGPVASYKDPKLALVKLLKQELGD